MIWDEEFKHLNVPEIPGRKNRMRPSSTCLPLVRHRSATVTRFPHGESFIIGGQCHQRGCCLAPRGAGSRFT